MSQETPTTITGGCLCEAIRYEITFPPNHDFKNKGSTCQCSQCRKQTGSLFMRAHQIPNSALSYTTPCETLRNYHASEGASRGFCNACGSYLYWRNDKRDSISMCVGTFDRDVLKRYGPLLTDVKVHLFCEDEIEGVTDHLKGERWQQDNE